MQPTTAGAKCVSASAKSHPSTKKYPAPPPPISQKSLTNADRDDADMGGVDTSVATTTTTIAVVEIAKATVTTAATTGINAATAKVTIAAAALTITATTAAAKTTSVATVASDSKEKSNKVVTATSSATVSCTASRFVLSPVMTSSTSSAASDASRNAYVRPPMQVMPMSRNVSVEEDRDVRKVAPMPGVLLPHLSSKTDGNMSKTNAAMRSHAAAVQSLNKQLNKSTNPSSARNSRNSCELSRHNTGLSQINTNNVIYDEPVNVYGTNSPNIDSKLPEMIISDGYIQLRTAQSKNDSGKNISSVGNNNAKSSSNVCDNSKSSSKNSIANNATICCSLKSEQVDKKCGNENSINNNSKIVCIKSQPRPVSTGSKVVSNISPNRPACLDVDDPVRPTRRAPPPPSGGAVRKPIVSNVKLVSRDSIKRRTATLGSKLRAYRSTNAIDHIELFFDTEDESPVDNECDQLESTDLGQGGKTETNNESNKSKTDSKLKKVSNQYNVKHSGRPIKVRYSDIGYSSSSDGPKQVQPTARSSFVDPEGPKQSCRSVYIDLGEYQTLLKHSRYEERRHYALPQPHCYGEDTLKAVKLITEKYDTFKRRQLQAASFRGTPGEAALGAIKDQDDADNSGIGDIDFMPASIMNTSDRELRTSDMHDIEGTFDKNVLETDQNRMSTSGTGVMDSARVEQILLRDYFTDSLSSVTDVDKASYLLGGLTQLERLRIAMFYRSKDSVVYVCASLADLFVGAVPALPESTFVPPSPMKGLSRPVEAGADKPDSMGNCERWIHVHTGVPVWVLNTGLGHKRRELHLVLAERETGFTLWKDRISHLSEYQCLGNSSTHLMRVSTSPLSKTAKLCMFCETGAERFMDTLLSLGADPDDEIWMISENGRRKSKNKAKASKKKCPPLSDNSILSATQTNRTVTSGNDKHSNADQNAFAVIQNKSKDRVKSKACRSNTKNDSRGAQNLEDFATDSSGGSSSEDEREIETLLYQNASKHSISKTENPRTTLTRDVNTAATKNSTEALNSNCSLLGRWRQSNRWRKPDKSTISHPCNFVHITRVDPHDANFRAAFADCLPLNTSPESSAGQAGPTSLSASPETSIHYEEDSYSFRPRLPTR